MYQRADDNSQVRLADLEQVKLPPRAQAPVGDRGIMRTFEFNSEDGRYETTPDRGMEFQQQHPWTGR